MAEEQAEPTCDGSWKDRALWVQDVVMRRLVETDEDGSTVLQSQMGDVRRYSRPELVDGFTAFGSDTVFKPAFRPVRAISFNRDTRVAVERGTIVVPRGDALIEHHDGRIEVMPRKAFNLRYRIVGHAAPTPPIAPFTTGRQSGGPVLA